MREHVVLKLEVDHMKHTMVTAIEKKHLEIEAMINRACDSFIQTDVLQKVITEEFEKVVQDEIRNYFSWGEGREAISQSVKDGLAKAINKSVKKRNSK